MPQWVSPKIALKNIEETIVVPYNGLYGVCFESGDKPPSDCRLEIVDHDDSNEKVPSTTSMSLPFTHENTLVNSIHVGKIIFLKQNSQIRFVPSVTNNDSTRRTDANKTILSGWIQLVFHRHVNDSNTFMNGHPVAAKKSFLCADCTRAFLNPKAVIQHIHTMHTPNSPSQPLPVIYQDTYMVVIVKPQGIAVQGDTETLLRSDLLLPFTLPKTTRIVWPDGGIDQPLKKARPVHRLDAGTGGLLVLAKTRRAEVALNIAFANRQAYKRYLAVVTGKLEGNGTVDKCVSGKAAVSHYRAVHHVSTATNGWLTLVDLEPQTGRRHQLRRHCAELGHPIVGDRRYGPSGDEKGGCSSPQLCLWAMELSLPHPVTNELVTFRMSEPEALSNVLSHESSME